MVLVSPFLGVLGGLILIQLGRNYGGRMDLAGVYFCVWSVHRQFSQRRDLPPAAGQIPCVAAVGLSVVHYAHPVL